MSEGSGKWLSMEDFARASGISESEAEEAIRSGGLTAKVVSGRQYVWADHPERAGKGTGDDVIEKPREDDGSSGESPDLERETKNPGSAGGDEVIGKGSGGDVMVGETLVSRLSWPQEMALQTERAISLVERSLNAFMMMHKEVVTEKDRFVDQSRQALQDRNHSYVEKDEKIEELEQALRDRDQEIADLKMLVGILEGQTERTRPKKAAEVSVISDELDERATVGDLMEDQLRYIMEDQLIKELLKE